MCEESFGDARERVEKESMHQSQQQDIIDGLVYLLAECREAMSYESPVWSVSDDEYKDLKRRVDATLALARGE